jgi:hypothetical protein
MHRERALKATQNTIQLKNWRSNARREVLLSHTKDQGLTKLRPGSAKRNCRVTGLNVELRDDDSALVW